MPHPNMLTEKYCCTTSDVFAIFTVRTPLLAIICCQFTFEVDGAQYTVKWPYLLARTRIALSHLTAHCPGFVRQYGPTLPVSSSVIELKIVCRERGTKQTENGMLLVLCMRCSSCPLLCLSCFLLAVLMRISYTPIYGRYLVMSTANPTFFRNIDPKTGVDMWEASPFRHTCSLETTRRTRHVLPSFSAGL